IDNSSSMHYPEIEKTNRQLLNKLSFSVHCAAAIIHMLRQQRDAVGLSIFSDRIELNTPAKSSSVHHKFLFNQLEKMLDENRLELNHKTSAASALHHIAESIHKRSMVVVFSDMMESAFDRSNELFAALQHLRHNK